MSGARNRRFRGKHSEEQCGSSCVRRWPASPSGRRLPAWLRRSRERRRCATAAGTAARPTTDPPAHGSPGGAPQGGDGADPVGAEGAECRRRPQDRGRQVLRGRAHRHGPDLHDPRRVRHRGQQQARRRARAAPQPDRQAQPPDRRRSGKRELHGDQAVRQLDALAGRLQSRRLPRSVLRGRALVQALLRGAVLGGLHARRRRQQLGHRARQRINVRRQLRRGLRRRLRSSSRTRATPGSRPRARR